MIKYLDTIMREEVWDDIVSNKELVKEVMSRLVRDNDLEKRSCPLLKLNQCATCVQELVPSYKIT